MAMAILKAMSDGKVLTIKDGYVIGMAENGFVGFVIEGKVSTFSEVTFSQLVGKSRPLSLTKVQQRARMR